jgi:hypothetical protein
VIGSDHAVYHLTQLGANSDSWAWEGLGGYVIGDPGTGLFFTATFSKVFEPFVVGSNRALYVNENPTFFPSIKNPEPITKLCLLSYWTPLG